MTDQLAEDGTGTEVKAARGPIRVPWAPVAKVNLLPVEIIEGRRFRRAQLMLGGTVIGVLGIAVGGVLLAQRQVEQANEELLVSQARVTALQAEEARYAAVPRVIAQVDAAVAARSLAMGTDVLWYRYLSDIDGAQPRGVTLTSVTLTLGETAGGAVGEILSVAGPGTMTIQGTAEKYSQVAAWLEASDKVDGFASPKLTDAADSGEIVTFSSTAVITTDALSGRYNKKDG